MRKLLLITLALAATFTASAQQTDPPRARTQEAAAAHGLALLQALAADKSRETGLSSADAARATLGKPLAVASVELAALRAFKAGDDASALIRPSAEAFYPVLLDGGVRSGVRVENGDGGWQVVRVGNAGLASALEAARGALPSPDEATLVQVLALNLVFVGHKGSGGWQLAPVIDDASLELKTGKLESAAEVFTRLAPIAARQNGDPT